MTYKRSSDRAMLTPQQRNKLEATALAWVTAQSQYERSLVSAIDVVVAASEFAGLLKSLTEKPLEPTT